MNMIKATTDSKNAEVKYSVHEMFQLFSDPVENAIAILSAVGRLNANGYAVTIDKKTAKPACLRAMTLRPGSPWTYPIKKETPAQQKIMEMINTLQYPNPVNDTNRALARKIGKLRQELWLAYEEASDPSVTLKF